MPAGTMKTHRIVIPTWHPARLNELMGGWRKRSRLKRSDRELVGFYGRVCAVPSAQGPRRISLIITLEPGQRAADPDAYWKSVLDALVRARLLVNDNRQWVELGAVDFIRGKARQTEIVLEDLG